MDFNNMTDMRNPSTWRLTPTTSGYQTQPIFEDQTFSSLDEVSLHLPNGAYTTFRTYFHTKALRLDEHFDRLNESAQRVFTPIRIDPDEVRASTRAILDQLVVGDYRIRLTLALEQEPGCVYFSAEQLHTPSQDEYTQGVKVITRVMHRMNPKAKLTGFIKDAHQIRQQLPPGLNEVLMVREDGMVLEGLSSNFFGIGAGLLLTSKEGVLAGITRAVLLDVSRELEIGVNFDGVFLSNISVLDEAFITSASRAVLPVVQIEQTKIGTGQPGQITRQLIARFQERIELEVQEI
jgi:branched-chain amino acid aminotransferase